MSQTSSNFPTDLKYTREHEWVRLENEMATIGVTDYAQEQMGDIVFVELPQEGEEFSKGDTFGVVESVKSVSDVFTPISSEIVEVNDPLPDSPEALNDDPYGEGWMIRVKILEPDELNELMSAEDYEAFIKEES
jgi:glycine cleavage system H protein